MSIRFAAVLLAAAAVSSCSIREDGIEADDDGMLFPTLRARIDLDRAGPVPLHSGPADRGTRGDLGILLEVSGAEGDASGDIDSNDVFEMDGENLIFGPADVEIDYSLGMASAAIAGSLFLPTGWVLTGFAGIAYTRMELEIDAPGQSIDETILGFGPVVGARASWWPSRTHGLYAQASTRAVFPEEFDSVTVDQLELGLEIAPSPGISLFGGWRWLAYQGEDQHWHHDDDETELDLELSGPVLGLSLSF
jgi:hypothetical protein